MTLDGQIGPAALSLGLSRLREHGTILGGRFSDALSSSGSASYFADGNMQVLLGGGWRGSASYRLGRTDMSVAGLATEGRLWSEAFAFDLSKGDALSAGDMLALRVSQPLRVRSGGYDLKVPISYDYATGSVGYERRLLSLAPTGREIDYEVAYGVRFLNGHLGLNAFLRSEPGHIETMKSDIGAAVKVSFGM